jgi:hypothetical protein
MPLLKINNLVDSQPSNSGSRAKVMGYKRLLAGSVFFVTDILLRWQNGVYSKSLQLANLWVGRTALRRKIEPVCDSRLSVTSVCTLLAGRE